MHTIRGERGGEDRAFVAAEDGNLVARVGVPDGAGAVVTGRDQSVPIGITVEGANILTRSLIIYGQGALRCHPFVFDEVEALAEKDLKRFDQAVFGHVGLTATSAVRSLILGITGGRFTPAPVEGVTACYFRRLTHFSSALVTLSDVAMGTLGGSLKRREKISGRFADALAWMYLCSATLKEFVEGGQKQEELPFMRWACEYAQYEIQQALVGVLQNFPSRPLALLLRGILFPTGTRLRPPGDKLGAEVVEMMLENPEARRSLTSDLYLPSIEEPGLGFLEHAFEKVVAAAEVARKVKDAVRSHKLSKTPRTDLYERAVQAEIITAEQLKQLQEADETRKAAIEVDSFQPKIHPELRPVSPPMSPSQGIVHR